MASWLRRTRSLAVYVMSGVACTLFMAWGLPLLLAARSIGPEDAPFVSWHRDPASDLWQDGSPMLLVHRATFSDLYIAQPARGTRDFTAYWPESELQTTTGETKYPPQTVVLAPPSEESSKWVRIETTLAGWPFRCFASEAWFRTDPESGRSSMPEFHAGAYIGLIGGRHILAPLRPLPFAIALNVFFWASLTWFVVALPREFRRRKREKYGACDACGHALDPTATRRPSQCPECGSQLRRDPLGFARSPEMHFQNHYTWFVFVSSLDIMLTWKILDRGGLEVNPVAKIVIDAWGMHGAIAFKFALMLWVIVACEVLARMKRSAGKFLAICAVVVSASPVAWSLFLLLYHELVPA